jgi:hypothetical protein
VSEYTLLTVAIPADWAEQVATVMVDLRMMDRPEDMPAPAWEGYGTTYVAFSAPMQLETALALGKAAYLRGMPTLTLHPGDEETPATKPEPGVILARWGGEALHVLGEMGLSQVKGSPEEPVTP